MRPVIRAEGLVKRYKEVTALDGLDLEVAEGQVLGLLGPNGAGKTTAVRILTTLLVPDGGRAEVAGIDVVADPNGVRSRIGLSGQYAAVDEHLTGFENLEMVGRLYRLSGRLQGAGSCSSASNCQAGDRPVKTYSGGMRRRLDLAAALVARPAVLFLDEPTTGLDPRSRASMWEIIRELAAGGTTLLLTTQYLEEADRLADDIVVIDHGRAIARGTADQLKSQIGGERVELVVESVEHLAAVKETLVRVAVGDVVIDEQSRRVTAPVAGGSGALIDVLRSLDGAVTILDVGLRRPTLDDVFLALTGHATAAERNGAPVDGATEKETIR